MKKNISTAGKEAANPKQQANCSKTHPNSPVSSPRSTRTSAPPPDRRWGICTRARSPGCSCASCRTAVSPCRRTTAVPALCAPSVSGSSPCGRSAARYRSTRPPRWSRRPSRRPWSAASRSGWAFPTERPSPSGSRTGCRPQFGRHDLRWVERITWPKRDIGSIVCF